MATNDLISVLDAAKMWGAPTLRLLMLIKQEMLPGEMCDGEWFVSRDSLADFSNRYEGKARTGSTLRRVVQGTSLAGPAVVPVILAEAGEGNLCRCGPRSAILAVMSRHPFSGRRVARIAQAMPWCRGATSS